LLGHGAEALPKSQRGVRLWAQRFRKRWSFTRRTMQQREVLDPHDLALKVGAAVFGCLLFFKYFWCLEGFVFRCNSLLFLGLSGTIFRADFWVHVAMNQH